MKTHFADPCIHCGVSHDQVLVGPCAGTGEPKPISFAVVERRWDGYLRYRIRFSDNHIEERWNHSSEHAPSFHFGHSDNLINPPRYDRKLLEETI